MPSKFEIFEYWKNSTYLINVDWYEPSCWACGEWFGGIYDIEFETATDEVRKQIWNSFPLQRCHIIPKSLGGSDSAENLFLMCRDCHDLAPNTKSKSLFLKWASNQPSRKAKEIAHAIESFELTDDELDILCAVFRKPEFKQGFHNNNVSLHWDQKSGGSHLTISTLIAAMITFSGIKKTNPEY